MKRTKGISGIYQILNAINGKSYIGSAINIKKRWKEHIWELIRNAHYNKYLQRSWNKYGKDAFKFIVLLRCEKKDLLYYEQIAIDKYKTAKNKNGYNLCPTVGNTLGIKLSQEARNRISQTLKGNIPWNKGIPCSEETKQKLSRALKGRPAWNVGTKLSEEGRLKLSIAHLGYDMPEEQRKKISKTLKKHLESNEHWNKGFHHSEETKQRIATFQKGQVRSEETKIRK